MQLRRAALVAGVLASAGCSFNQVGLDPADAGGDGASADAADAAGTGDGGPVDARADAQPVPTAFEKPITIRGSRVSGELEDFPVYLELTDADLQARATSAGADIYFVAAQGGERLDHELQRWDPQSGRLEAWVRLPLLEEGVDVDILVRYGDVDAAPTPDPAGVWTAGFVAVWHLEQSPAGGADALLDSAGTRHGTASGSLNADRLVSATLGRGLRFAGGSDEVTFSNPLTGASPHTISAWVDQEATTTNDALVVLGNGACGQARWFHTRFTGNAVAVGFYCDDVTGGPNVQRQGPTLLHWTYDEDADTRIYRDGALVLGPTAHLGTQSTSGAIGRIGNAPAAFGQNMGLLAVLDEVRIATVARSADWIATEYANQSAPGDFVIVGDERPLL